MKDQTVWKDRQEQSVFCKGISTLVGIKFGSIFISDEQGGGEVSILVLQGRGVSGNKMKEVKKYIKNSFKLEEKDISLNHGHTKGTIVVNMSEINLASKKIIEEEIYNKIILPDRVKKTKDRHLKLPIQKTLPIPISSNKIEELKVATEEIKVEQTIEIETQPKTTITMETISLIKKGRSLFSSFLTTMFRFEGIISDKKDKIFEFEKKKKDQDCQTISFRNETEAEMAHKALTWFYGEANDLPILEGRDVMVNFFAYDLQIERPIYISFCFPPVQGEDIEKIKKRCIHVLTGYKPSVLEIINDDFFKVNYPRVSTTNKFFGLIQKMGWQAEMRDDLIICKFRPKPEVAAENNPTTATSTETEEVITTPDVSESTPEAEEVALVSEPVKKVLDLGTNFLSPRSMPLLAEESSKLISIKDLFSQAEAILKFKEMYKDDIRWSPVPSEKKAKIIDILRKDLRSSEPQVFAKYLLGIYLDKRPLFTTEEAIVEFQSMMASPDFSQYPVAIQNGIISTIKDNLSDEDLLDGLLDLF